jgi:hypothetical protein
MLSKANMELKPKTHKQDKALINQLRDGSEWSPGKPIQHKAAPTPPARSTTQVIEDILINWFLFEQPRADEVQLVNNSLQLVDAAHNIWKAKVQTFVYFPTIEPRIHESSVRFRVEARPDKKNPKLTHYSIYHNHIIFPS